MDGIRRKKLKNDLKGVLIQSTITSNQMPITSDSSCAVCTETFNTTSRGRVECPQCKKDACRSCYRRYLTSRFQEPCCMHCSVAFKMDQIHDSFPKSFWTNDYKKHREQMLFSLEVSQCAATLPYVEIAAERDVANAGLHACRSEIVELTKQLKQKKSQERALLARVHDLNARFATTSHITRQVKTNASEYNVPCSTPQCRGFVSKDIPKCACCSQSTCYRCHQTVAIPTPGHPAIATPSGTDAQEPIGHVCAEDDVATVQELRRNAKQCPECRVYISKVDGCDQMFCVSCHTAFSWNTGQRINGPIHNPHYFEVRARLGNVGPDAANPPQNQHGCDEFPSIHTLRACINHGQQLRPEIELAYRYTLHLREVVCEDLRMSGRDYSFATNLERRVDWMRKKMTDEQFRQHLHRNDKRARYNTELLSLFQMHTNVVGALFQNMVVQKTTGAYDDIVKLREYTMDNLNSIRARYGSDNRQYDKYVSCEYRPAPARHVFT